MNSVNDQITFEISERSSAALWEIIYAKKWQLRKSFSLPIRKGPFLALFEGLIKPPVMFEFHVGCVLDRRPPNFGYEASRENKGVRLCFYYWRKLTLEVFEKNTWFHDASGMRDLKAVAYAMSQPKNYEELIGLAGSYRDEVLGHCDQVKFYFKGEQCHVLENLEAIQEEPIKSALTGFAGCYLDLQSGPFSVHRETLLKTQWTSADVLTACGLDIELMVRELHRLWSSEGA